MIEDIHEPVDLYRRSFKEAHARNTSEYFEDLLRTSGVDEHANAQTVQELRTLGYDVADTGSSLKRWKFLRWAVIAFGVFCLFRAWKGHAPLWLLGSVGAATLIFLKLNQKIKDINEYHQQIEQQREVKLEEAWKQMAPLNRLYDWDIMAKLVQKTLPRVQLDPYFANARLDELRRNFGWDDGFNKGRSVVFSHTGVLNGNPFVLAQTLDHWVGTKTYHGSRTISWTEEISNSKGERETVTRYQTLNASVEKPHPEYGARTMIIYGNEAAPDLSFSRSPSKLSKLGDGFISNMRKKIAVNQLESKSRDSSEERTFTVMENREFDSLFGATDRDHEVQFRLLFTPLAQQEMLKLLKDTEVGYGDDFEFEKVRMINRVEPAHMSKKDISADPAKFRTYELAEARSLFNQYHNSIFKSFFFGLAPLLSIPLYQQHRSHSDIYKDVYGRSSCFWEHEAIANYFGEKQFQHPECVTRSILKTQSQAEADGTQRVQVTASGYKGVNRTEYVSRFGDDGRFHDIPVHWVEYSGVHRTSVMLVREDSPKHDEGNAEPTSNVEEMWQSKIQSFGINPENTVKRRSIFSALVAN